MHPFQKYSTSKFSILSECCQDVVVMLSFSCHYLVVILSRCYQDVIKILSECCHCQKLYSNLICLETKPKKFCPPLAIDQNVRYFIGFACHTIYLHICLVVEAESWVTISLGDQQLKQNLCFNF